MKTDNEKATNFGISRIWILLGIILIIFGGIPTIFHQTPQLIVMILVGIVCLVTGLYGRRQEKNE